MKQLIFDIKNRLSEIPELKYVDFDWGQMDNYTNPPVKYPCVLIDIQQGEYSYETKASQKSEIGISLRIADKITNDGSSDTPINNNDSIFTLFDIADKIFVKLHEWRPSSCNNEPLLRTSMKKNDRKDKVKEYQIGYSIVVSESL